MQIFACKHTAYYDRTIFHLIRKNFGGVSHKNNLKFFEKTWDLDKSFDCTCGRWDFACVLTFFSVNKLLLISGGRPRSQLTHFDTLGPYTARFFKKLKILAPRIGYSVYWTLIFEKSQLLKFVTYGSMYLTPNFDFSRESILVHIHYLAPLSPLRGRFFKKSTGLIPNMTLGIAYRLRNTPKSVFLKGSHS